MIPFWQDKCLTGAGPTACGPVLLGTPTAGPVLEAASCSVFLGLDGPAGVFAADLSGLAEPAARRVAGARAAVEVRRLFGSVDAQQDATLAYARGILRWNREQPFCGACGHASRSWHGGTQRLCSSPACGRLLFPRIEPAVITLVESPGLPRRCLLARHRGAAELAYATLAGFVEIGESLEDAVRREVAEETGVLVAEVSYQASQAWPFPSGLMIGFRGLATTEEITVDPGELEEARWFSRAETAGLVARGPGRHGDSIEAFLIDAWLHGGDS